MTDLQLIKKAREYVSEFLSGESTGHDLHHIDRVYRLAMELAKEETADILVVGLAALLHDIDDYKISTGTNRAKTFLENNCPEKLFPVMEIIDNMSYSSHRQGKKVTSLEGMIVQDADRLDAIGAIGIARVFAYTGKTGRPLYTGNPDDESAIAHFYEKLFKLEQLMNTEKAKAIAKDRTEFMKTYLERFYQEWDGE